jgi:hypothetical protein
MRSAIRDQFVYERLYSGFNQVAHMPEFIGRQAPGAGYGPVFAPPGANKGALVAAPHRGHEIVLNIGNVIERPGRVGAQVIADRKNGKNEK